MNKLRRDSVTPFSALSRPAARVVAAILMLGCEATGSSGGAAGDALSGDASPGSDVTPELSFPDARESGGEADVAAGPAEPVEADAEAGSWVDSAPQGEDATAAADVPSADVGTPFVPPVETAPDQAGLTNVGTNLTAVLEGGKLAGACDAWFATKGQGTLKQKLLCGKAMFFYESFGTYGIPQVMADFMIQKLPESVGPGMEKFGLYADPTSAKQLPLGLAPGANLPDTTVPSYTFTCASCHFGKTPDGRYAVGQANHDYDYGRQILAFNLFAKLATGLEPASQHNAKAVAAIQPLIDEYKANPFLAFEFGLALLQLTSALSAVPAFSPADEAAYASWKPGTQDFLMTPVVVDDGVHTVSKIISLFNLPTTAQIESGGMTHAMLGWTGVAGSLVNFLRGFAALGAGNADWPDEKLEPLKAYLESLSAPENPNPPPAAQVSQGAQLFVDKGCVTCHDGPAYSGTRVYSYAEIGTDAAMGAWLDPDWDGEPMPNPILMAGDQITNGIKSPRLRGLWTAKLLLHNGSVNSLEELFCLGSDRPTVVAPVFSDGGHMMTCDGLTNSEKTALIAYLRTL